MTRRHQPDGSGWLVGALLGGTALVGGFLWTVVTWPRTPSPPAVPPPDDRPTPRNFTEVDVEAAARMLASENPRGSRALHIEQIHTQLRARRPGQSLYDRITAGSGWGSQGAHSPGGGVRPVSTTESANTALRKLTREVLEGVHASLLPGARKFFEPAQQDRAFALAEQARRKRAAGQPLTKQEERLLGYHRTADEMRRKWLGEGSRFIGSVDQVEFYS